MKWKTALTAEEAALFATGLEEYKTLKAVRQELKIKNNPPPWSDTEAVMAELAEFKSKAQVADEIYQALLSEIVLADPYDLYEHLKGDVSSVLDVAIRAQCSEVEDWIVPEKSTVSKLSLAKWFWPHDPDIAKKFWPDITEDLVHSAQPEQAVLPENKTPAAKTVNSLLKTVSALSEALIGGLTDKPNTNAEAVMAALAAKKIPEPVGKRTLAKYLEQAEEM